MSGADKGKPQPDPTKSVADEIERRKETGPQDHPTPEVTTEFGGPTSKSEAESDKSWSRAAGEVQEREFQREGTSPSEPKPPQG